MGTALVKVDEGEENLLHLFYKLVHLGGEVLRDLFFKLAHQAGGLKDPYA